MIPGWLQIIAASGGRVDILQCLHDSGIAIHATTFRCAAEKGKVAVLAWAHRFCGHSVSEAVEHGAKAGSFATLKWAEAAGVPFTERVLRGAILSEKLNIIKWLHARKCPGWDGDLPAMACKHARKAVTDWLVRNNSSIERSGGAGQS
ncbi:hypothetical protein JKP88DRAFT_174690 [Tribonema minus]|uniref:Uncharacterized protein n=1 Tax=Tribonema minus TaxID=303371 RepID=A0A835ZHH1_9STRA|nr:hypothetical protein JKP88DRAFT_174690 [Tribonema minus]